MDGTYYLMSSTVGGSVRVTRCEREGPGEHAFEAQVETMERI